MKLYRVQVTVPVMIVAKDAEEAEDAARYFVREELNEATFEAAEIRHDAELDAGFAESLPYFGDSVPAADIISDNRTCREWLDYIATLPPSDTELEAQGQSTMFEGDAA